MRSSPLLTLERTAFTLRPTLVVLKAFFAVVSLRPTAALALFPAEVSLAVSLGATRLLTRASPLPAAPSPRPTTLPATLPSGPSATPNAPSRRMVLALMPSNLFFLPRRVFSTSFPAAPPAAPDAKSAPTRAGPARPPVPTVSAAAPAIMAPPTTMDAPIEAA